MAAWSHAPRAAVLTAFVIALAPAASRAHTERPTEGAQPCFVLAGRDPLDLLTVTQAQPPKSRIEGGHAITKEEIPLLIRDLERVPLETGGWTIRAVREASLPADRLRVLVGDLRSVFALQHGREVLAVLRDMPGIEPRDIREFEQSVGDIAGCTLERIGGESAFQDTLQLIRGHRADLEAAVLEPLSPQIQMAK